MTDYGLKLTIAYIPVYSVLHIAYFRVSHQSEPQSHSFSVVLLQAVSHDISVSSLHTSLVAIIHKNFHYVFGNF